MILFEDACPRQESRTRRPAEALLSRLGGEVQHLALSKAITVIISTPFRDLSFPADGSDIAGNDAEAILQHRMAEPAEQEYLS